METPGEFAAFLTGAAEEGPRRAQRIVRDHGMALLAGVKRRASRSRTEPSVAGLGPRVQTGDYLRSIGVRYGQNGDTIWASVGTNKVQGARLEFGFDAPGQRTLPHPHFGPAMDEEGPKFVEAMGELRDDLGGARVVGAAGTIGRHLAGGGV